jgi:hypothetical protein
MQAGEADRRSFDYRSKVRILGGQVRQPVLRTSRCGGPGSLAADLVEGDCDIEGAVGRLVDDVELERVGQRP